MKISAIILKISTDSIPAGLKDFSPYIVGKLLGKSAVYVIRNPQTKRFEGLKYLSGKIISVGIPQENPPKFI